MTFPPSMSVSLLALLTGCDGDPPSNGRTSGDTSEPPVWAFAVPELDGDELVPGLDAALWIDGLPPGASVVFYQASGLEFSECLGAAVGCSRVVAPVEYGTATADVYGEARFTASVPGDALPAVVFFQAVVSDPASGASSWSLPIQRHVSIPPSRSTVSLMDRTQGAGVGVFTFGNSHTGGVAWPDINGDLWPDLFVGNGGGQNHRLFRNDGDGTFTDVSTVVPKRSLQLEDAQPSFADIDGDGDVDLLVVVDSAFQMDSEIVQPREGGPNALYVNQGDGTFTEEAAARGLVDPRGWRNITGAFADIDGDGDVDVHLGTWAMNQPGQDRFGRLLLNDGTGQFTDAGVELGYGRDVLTTLAADVDVDGFPELYLGDVNKITGFVGSNPAADDVMYRNDHGVLVDVTAGSPGIGDEAWAAMGLDVGDVDNDGDFDLYEADRWEVEDPLPRGNPFYRNNGDGTFTDNQCDLAGICTGYASWPTQFADFDRDGWVDLWVGTGKEWYLDLVYVNQRDGTFASTSVPSLTGNAARGSATADYDGDGSIDLYVWNLGADSRLYVNTPRDDHHWLEVKLAGAGSNTEAIGAVVKLVTAAGAQLRRVSGGDGAHSQSSSILHFGLGNAAGPVRLEITWPGGGHQIVTDVQVDRLVRVDATGVLPDRLLDPVATWQDGALTVSTRSAYGGRTGLLTPFGPLGWDPETTSFVGGFTVAEPLETVQITSALGPVFEVPVTVVP